MFNPISGKITHALKNEVCDGSNEREPAEEDQRPGDPEDLSTSKAGNRPIAQWAVFADRVMRVYRRKDFLIAGPAEDHVFASGEPIATVRAQFSRVRDGLSTFRAFLEHLIRLPNSSSGYVGLSVETGASTSVAS